jgi:hydroxyacylglutathione hydrolase
MSLQISLIPALSDNYMYLFAAGGKHTVVDPAVAPPVLQALGQNRLDAILLTHHHGDHTAGAQELAETFGCPLYGSALDVSAGRLPPGTSPLREGEILDLGTPAEVLATPGHTAGHISFYLPAGPALFCGDTLFAGGCGRLLGGTAADMFASLKKLEKLPPETKIYCGHEYTEANLRFANTMLPDHEDILNRLQQVEALRAAGQPTIPSTMAEEQNTNLFLMATTVEGFAALRQAKDSF